jgi:hypothetical protein
MSILNPKTNPKEFVIALYSRPNESFPSKLDVMVNGHVGVLVEGQPCVLPRFLVDQAMQSHQFTHREKPMSQGDDTYETLVVKPNIVTTVIDAEYQSPEGIQRLLADASKIKDPDSPYYRLRLGCKNLVYGDMRSAEKEASEAVKNSPKAIDMENLQLKAKLYESNEALNAMKAEQSEIKKMLAELLSGKSPAPTTVFEVKVASMNDEAERTYEGKVYKTVAARKAAESKAAKVEAPENAFEEFVEAIEEKAVEVDV